MKLEAEPTPLSSKKATHNSAACLRQNCRRCNPPEGLHTEQAQLKVPPKAI